MGTNTYTENGVTKSVTVTGPSTAPAVFVAAPATSTSSGAPNQIAQDGTYLYVCVATNSWMRIAMSAF